MTLTQPVIIEVALNGAVPKAVNPHVPRTREEVVHDAILCISAGAAIVHHHNDEPVVGGPPSHDPGRYENVWRAVLAEQPNAILYPTMRGSGPDTTIEARYSHIVRLAELGILGTAVIDLGPINVTRLTEAGLPQATDDVYVNTYRDIAYMFEVCSTRQLPISLAAFEPGHLRAGLAYINAGLAPPGSMLKLFFDAAPMGVAGRGLPPTASGLRAYTDMLKGFDIPWMAVVTGSPDFPTVFYRSVVEAGGHISVGIERTGGRGGSTNSDLVRAAADLCRSTGRTPLDCAQARSFLGFGTHATP